MVTDIQKTLETIAESQKQQAQAFKDLSDQFKGKCPTGIPLASGDVFQTALERIKKSSALLAGWRRMLMQYAGQISQVIGCKLGDMAALGQAPDISFHELSEAFR
jgi:hypothetical protein